MNIDVIKKQANMKSFLQPTPRVLVSCRGFNGENNVLAVGYCSNRSYAPPTDGLRLTDIKLPEIRWNAI